MADAASLRDLLTPEGQEALQEAMRQASPALGFLPLYQHLSRHHRASLARAAAEQALLRAKARDKFDDADRLYFEREALEQSTPQAIAAYRASRFAGTPIIFDLGCGIGGDTLALARQATVVAVDIDRHRLAVLGMNARVRGVAGRVRGLLADVHSPAWRFPPGAAAFFDPARRRAGRRVRAPERYQPPLEVIRDWLPHLSAMAVKVSPAIDLARLAGYDCEVEFIALGAELKEACLWFGSQRTASRRATVLPGPHTLTAMTEPDLGVSLPLAYLYEPNPAVMRAGLVRFLGEQLSARLLDATTAFLTSDSCTATPFARAYRVVDFLPFQLKQLRARLRQMDVGRLTVKKRGSAITPDELIRKLHLRGEAEATLVLTRVMGQHAVLIVQPVSSNNCLRT